MKKKLYFLSMLAAGLTLAGCNDDLGDGPGNDIQSGDKGYVKIAINLPTTSGQVTRSQNDQFDDGKKTEYEVKSGLIAFFQGVEEANAHFVKAYNLTLNDWNDSEPEQGYNITTKKEVTLNEVPIPETPAYNTYALVVLNANNLVSVGENGALTVNGNTVPTTATLYSSDLMKAITTSAADMTKNGFFMTNAPIANGPSQSQEWDVSVTTLAPVNVSTTEPVTADPIYVERSVAKVEVNVSDNIIEGNKGESVKVKVYETGTSVPKTNHYVTFQGWKLNITNKSTKLVRDVVGGNPSFQPAARYWASLFNLNAQVPENRFFGLAGNPYRTYWAIDGNYDDQVGSDNAESYQEMHFNNISKITEEPIEWNSMYIDGETSKEYCLENTMSATNMMQGLTTGVILKGQYTVEDLQDPNGDFFTLGTSNEIFGTTEMLNYINGILAYYGSVNKYEFNRDGNKGNGCTIKSGEDFQKFFMKDGGGMTPEDADILMKDTRVSSINFYYGGETYFWTKPIKHFGDYYTPIKGEYVESSENYTDNEHLGRYGVVRNNWYQIEIASVSNPGLPEIPELPVDPGDPDDPKEGYVKVEINVLSWAKRTQNVDL